MECNNLLKEALDALNNMSKDDIPELINHESLTPMINNLNKSGLTIKPKGNKYTFEVTSPDGFKAIVRKYDDKFTVYTGENIEGQGKAYNTYSKLWDMAKAIKLPYSPDTELSFTNQKRLTANMLKYIAKHPKGNKYITISPNQWGGENLAGKPLTPDNAKKLASNFIDRIESDFLDKNSFATMNDKEANKVSNELGSMENVRIGKDTISRLRKYAKTGNIAGVVGVLETSGILDNDKSN